MGTGVRGVFRDLSLLFRWSIILEALGYRFPWSSLTGRLLGLVKSWGLHLSGDSSGLSAVVGLSLGGAGVLFKLWELQQAVSRPLICLHVVDQFEIR